MLTPSKTTTTKSLLLDILIRAPALYSKLIETSSLNCQHTDADKLCETKQVQGYESLSTVWLEAI